MRDVSEWYVKNRQFEGIIIKNERKKSKKAKDSDRWGVIRVKYARRSSSGNAECVM